jgi:branched-chain amino acid transport system substrate-binding protein
MISRQRPLANLMFFLPFALVIAGCGTGSRPENPSAIRIGVVLPFSGQLAAWGEEGKQAIELAVEQASTSPANRAAKVLYEDSKGDASDAVRAFRKLVDVDHVAAVIGEVTSSSTLAIAPVAQELKIPLVVPASTNQDITKAGNYVLRICFLDPQQGAAMAAFAFNKLGKRKIAILYDNGSDYSAGLADAFQRSFEALGGKVVGKAVSKSADSDVRAQLLQIKSWQPDAVFLPFEYPHAAQTLRQAKTVNLNCTFLGGDAWSSPELFNIAGNAADGAFITAHFAPDSKSPVVVSFVSAFTAKYGRPPGNMAALSYDAARILIHAATVRTAATSEALRHALFATADFQGVTGTISIGPDGNAKKEIMILKTASAKFEYVDTLRAQ